jgi:hypothetical protein
LVRNGGQFTDNSGAVVFVEAGGSVITTTSGHGLYYVKRGGSITIPDQPTLDYVIADSSVSVTLPQDHDGLIVLHCNDLQFGITYDTAFIMNRNEWDAGSLPPGSSDSVFLAITNKSDPGVTLTGNVGSPSDPAFTVPNGGGAFSLAEKAFKSVWVVYHSDGKAHSASLLVHGPRPQDTIRVALTAEAYSNAGVESLSDQVISIRQQSNHLFVQAAAHFSLRLLNILGAELLRSEGNSSLDLDLAPIESGVYFAFVESGGQRAMQKVIVAK